MALLDVILGYDCNLACDYCTVQPDAPAGMRARALSTAAVLRALDEGRRRGYQSVSFTGGEPTIRRDLVGLVAAARARGFTDVKLQSNGLLLAHAPNVARLVRAGVTRFHVSIHAHDAQQYDALVRRDGSHALMSAAVDNIVATGLPFVADAIVKSDTHARLPAAIDWLADKGVRRVDLWYVSLTDGNRDNLASLPRMTDAMPPLRAAFARGRARGVDVRSLHVPRCLLGADADRAFDPGADAVLVVTPDAHFELEDSRLAGRVHVAACDGCEHRAVCPGIRPDYLEVFGDDEIAAARSRPATVKATRRLPVVA